MRSYVRRSADQLGPLLDLALISFAALYFEMVAIRWLASDVRVFAYLKNLPLLAAFLGLGLGCLRPSAPPAGRKGAPPAGLGWFPLLCLVFAAVVAFAGPLDLVHLYFPQDGLWVWNDGNFDTRGLSPLVLSVRFFVVVLALFLLVVALFASLGERLGALFDRLPPTRAYGVNLVGSLAGIWAFAVVSALGWPPAGWFALGFLVLLRFALLGLASPGGSGPPGRWRLRRLVPRLPRAQAPETPPPAQSRRARRWARAALALALCAVTLGLVAAAPGATRWSPYYRIDVQPIRPEGAPAAAPLGYSLTVNHDYHQKALDLSDGTVRAHPGPLLETARLAYDLPYRLVQPRRVLVVGAGMGNDVAAALRHGASRVDAVEIDPAILELGRTLHPERPYGSPRVRLFNEDARAFFARSSEQYDLIVFGLLDSHTLLASLSSLRLDSYVYTVESLQQARAHLAPGGHLALAFSASVGSWDWLAARLFQMIATAFGEEPVVLTVGYDVSTLYVVGPGARERIAADPALAALAVDPARLRVPLPPATDDWPFLYLRDRGVPLLPYGVTLVLVLLLGGGLVVLTLRGAEREAGAPRPAADIPMFLLGAAFMLLETKSISQLALLLGSTWLVTALIVSAILLLALVANCFVAWWRPTHVGPAYALLGAALLLDYALPLSALGGQDALVRAVLGSLLLALPLLFAGVVFATLFARTTAPSRAFGSNLLGALAGGLLEYASMATGFKALGLVALALYAASWLALRRQPLLAQARRARTWRRARARRAVPSTEVVPLRIGPLDSPPAP